MCVHVSVTYNINFHTVYVYILASRCQGQTQCFGSGFILSQFYSLANRKGRFMTISEMLQLKKDSNLIISPEKFKIKRSKDRKKLNIFTYFHLYAR